MDFSRLTRIHGFFNHCFEKSEFKDIIKHSHLPEVDGFYVTERDTILKLKNTVTIFRLFEGAWLPDQHYAELWYDSLDMFSDIPEEYCIALDLANRKELPIPKELVRASADTCFELEDFLKSL